MNSCRLTRHLVNGTRRFSSVLFFGKYRTVNQTFCNNPSSVRSYYDGCRIFESFRTRLRKGLQRHGTALWFACSHQVRFPQIKISYDVLCETRLIYKVKLCRYNFMTAFYSSAMLALLPFWGYVVFCQNFDCSCCVTLFSVPLII